MAEFQLVKLATFYRIQSRKLLSTWNAPSNPPSEYLIWVTPSTRLVSWRSVSWRASCFAKTWRHQPRSPKLSSLHLLWCSRRKQQDKLLISESDKFYIPTSISVKWAGLFISKFPNLRGLRETFWMLNKSVQKPIPRLLRLLQFFGFHFLMPKTWTLETCGFAVSFLREPTLLGPWTL